METILLRENERYRDNLVLKESLKEIYPVYNHQISVPSNERYSLEHQWNIGKLIPIVITINDLNHIEDVLKIIELKKCK